MNKQKVSILNIALASGGAEKVISLLLKKLVIDFDVTLILLYDKIHFEIPDEVNTKILSTNSAVDGISFFRQLTDAIQFTRKYLSLVKSEEVDIAVSFLAFPNFINSIAKIRFSKLKTIISERGYPSENTTSKLSYFISKICYPLLYNRNSKLFSNSIYINEDLAENFRIKIPMEVIYNPIEIPVKTVKPDKLAFNEKSLKIVNVGTVNERKNQVMIIKAIAFVDLGMKLDIYGNGPLKDNLESRIKDLNLIHNIQLKGTVANVSEHLINYTCFVLSSNTEGFPNALLEAMAVGLPCISTNCLSGPLELLNESDKKIEIPKGGFYKAKYGLLVNNNDYHGLGQALIFYQKNAIERKKYGALANKRAQDFELAVVYKKFKSFILS